MNKLRCRYCKDYFNRGDGIKVPLGFFCTIEHARLHGQEKDKKTRAKSERAKLKDRKEALKTLTQHKNELQVIFNKFIRVRDKDKPCISCGRYHQGQQHCGHYLSVGARDILRFNEDNCHKQCAPCNNHLSGNIANYRINLIEKIGLDRVETLECNHKPSSFTIEEINEMKAHYKKRIKEMA